MLLLGLGANLGESALVEFVDARVGGAVAEGGTLTVVVLEVGLGPFLVCGLAGCEQVGVGGDPGVGMTLMVQKDWARAQKEAVTV